MRKRWFWLLLLGLIGVITIAAGQDPNGWLQTLVQEPSSSFAIESSPAAQQNGATHTAAAIAPPVIDRNRLLSDLDALAAGVRYNDDEREQTRSFITQSLIAAGWSPQQQRFEGGVNIYAQKDGVNSTARPLLLGAHLDTVARSPGADDNATAVAAVLEAARLFGSAATQRPLVVALFDLEEAGLLGSEAFVTTLADSLNLEAAIILEMLGYACHTEGCQTYPPVLPITPPTTTGDFLAVIGDQGHPSLVNAFAQAQIADAPQVLTLAIPLLGRFTPDVLRSDHAPFWRNGIGAVMVTDTANFRNPHYHQVSDTPDTLDPDFFAGSVQLVINAMTQLLNDPTPLDNVNSG